MEGHCSVDFVNVSIFERKNEALKITSVDNIALVAASTIGDDEKHFLNLVYLTSDKISESLYYRYQLFPNHTVCLQSGSNALIFLDQDLNTAMILEFPLNACMPYVITFLVGIAKIFVLKDKLESKVPKDDSAASIAPWGKELFEATTIVSAKVNKIIKYTRDFVDSKVDSYLVGVKNCEENEIDFLSEKVNIELNNISVASEKEKKARAEKVLAIVNLAYLAVENTKAYLQTDGAKFLSQMAKIEQAKAELVVNDGLEFAGYSTSALLEVIFTLYAIPVQVTTICTDNLKKIITHKYGGTAQLEQVKDAISSLEEMRNTETLMDFVSQIHSTQP